MASLFKLVGEIVIDNEKANSEIDETVKKAETAESSMSESFSKIGESCLKVGGYVTTAAVAVGTYLFNVAENTREYRTEIGKLETAFTSSGHSVETAKNTFKELQSVLGDTGQAVEAANNLAKLTTNEQELAEWTNICVGAFASFGGISISGLTESANETAKVGQVVGTLADALNWAGASEDDINSKLSACSTEQERQQVILETLTGLYASAAEQYRETNAEIIASNTAHNNLNAAMAGIGAAAEPAVTVLVNAAAKIAEAVTPVVEALADAVVALGDAWVALSEKMKDITASITVHTNGVSTAAAGVGAAVTEATGSGFWGTLADNFVKNSAVNPDAPWLSGLPGFATGLDYVPNDNFVARLHEGEAVLTKQEAGEWRNGGDIASAVRDAMSGIQFNVMLDSGVLVGQLAPQMDMRLGTISGRKGRGN